MTPLGVSFTPQSASPAKAADLQALARDLETTFIAEMLKHSGLGDAQSSFGGGIGEEQFASFRLQQTAEQIANNGGIGLAESIFQSLVERTK